MSNVLPNNIPNNTVVGNTRTGLPVINRSGIPKTPNGTRAYKVGNGIYTTAITLNQAIKNAQAKDRALANLGPKRFWQRSKTYNAKFNAAKKAAENAWAKVKELRNK
jgi:hypothetical protein